MDETTERFHWRSALLWGCFWGVAEALIEVAVSFAPEPAAGFVLVAIGLCIVLAFDFITIQIWTRPGIQTHLHQRWFLLPAMGVIMIVHASPWRALAVRITGSAHGMGYWALFLATLLVAFCPLYIARRCIQGRDRIAQGA